MTSAAIQKIEGLQTVETAQEALGLTRQSTINLLSKLKKQGHVTTTGGGKQPRFYKITCYKQRPRKEGMFDLLNKHNPHFKLAEWYDHQVHGKYTVEDAILDAIDTKSFRAILATLRCFNYVKDWKKLYNEAKKRNSWNKIGALYDVARLFFRTRKMPKRYRKLHEKKRIELINGFKTTEEQYKRISEEWRVQIPFNRHDVRDL
ncbi:hypothetical protein GOV07_02845 [Candidatus Woesearchaeota archaeon]|nr:hypothetical protein [Candidatus Woesearchaeota archaeon]